MGRCAPGAVMAGQQNHWSPRSSSVVITSEPRFDCSKTTLLSHNQVTTGDEAGADVPRRPQVRTENVTAILRGWGARVGSASLSSERASERHSLAPHEVQGGKQAGRQAGNTVW